MRNVILIAILVAVGAAGIWYAYYAHESEPAVRVVNVLPKELYDDAHIPGSIHVDIDQLDEKMRQWDPDTPVVFYCSNYTCQASKDAARTFRNYGFKRVYAYEGGMAEWYQLSQEDSEYGVVGPAEQVASYTPATTPDVSGEDADMIITAQELQKLLKNGILPNKS